MALKSLVAALALVGASVASAETIAPVASGSLVTSFPTADLFSLDPTCGAPRPGQPGQAPFFGFSGSDVIAEGRTNFEYQRPDAGPDAKLTLSFDVGIDNGSGFNICVHGYSADGAITPADFQLEDAIFLGERTLQFEDGLLDVSDLLDLGGPIFGIQFSLNSFEDSNGQIIDVLLTLEEAQAIREPGALALLGTGMAMLAARWRWRSRSWGEEPLKATRVHRSMAGSQSDRARSSA